MLTRARKTLEPVARHSAILWLGFISLPVVMAGCEADLRLDRVQATAAESVRRTDQFLAVETTADGGLWAFADDGVVLTGAESELASGVSWTRHELPEAPNFIDSTVCPDGSVLALSFENQLWLSDGEQWLSRSVPTEEQLQTVLCSSAATVWVAGAFGTLMSSADKGQTWQDLSVYEDFTITAMAFLPNGTGYAAGEFGTLLTTTNGGQDWEMLEPVAEDFYPLALHFKTPEEGWVSGVLGLIFHTSDGGQSWSTQPTATSASIYGFAETGDSLFAYGDLGALLAYNEDSGEWLDHPSPPLPVHYADAAVIREMILLVGGWGVITQVPVAPPAVPAMASGGGH